MPSYFFQSEFFNNSWIRQVWLKVMMITNHLFSNVLISNNNKIKINQKTKSNSFEGVGFSINIWNLKGIKINKLINYFILNVWERKSGKVVGM